MNTSRRVQTFSEATMVCNTLLGRITVALETSVSLHRTVTSRTDLETAASGKQVSTTLRSLYSSPLLSTTPYPEEAIALPLDQALESCLPPITLQLKCNSLIN